MTIKVLMPALSPTMSEGVINKWLVNIGDNVSAGDILAEIETDKATMEVEAVDEGKITHLIDVYPDKKITVNSVIALINGKENEKLEDYNKIESKNSNEINETEIQLDLKNENDKNQKIETITKNNRDQKIIFATPFVKKFSKDNNIDLNLINGSGPEGRIVKKDIEKFELKIDDENILITEPSSIRKIIAERTTKTKNLVPHFYLTIETRMDKIISLRKKVNQNSKIKISFNDLIIKACAMSLSKNPQTNISWVNGKIHQYKSIDIAIAVALKEGLITPIIKNADKKGLAEISSEVKALIIKANQNKLLPDEYNGGSITISNLGMFGITEFQAIINPPQSSIIAIGSILKKPLVNNDVIEVGHTMKSTISADHRALDGAVAAKLLKDFNDILEDPFQIWLNTYDMEVI
tara:strand:+ start:1177 stop:2403 length:1227 start_codon:yes stop_codon:yes gene_type:complete